MPARMRRREAAKVGGILLGMLGLTATAVYFADRVSRESWPAPVHYESTTLADLSNVTKNFGCPIGKAVQLEGVRLTYNPQRSRYADRDIFVMKDAVPEPNAINDPATFDLALPPGSYDSTKQPLNVGSRLLEDGAVRISGSVAQPKGVCVVAVHSAQVMGP